MLVKFYNTINTDCLFENKFYLKESKFITTNQLILDIAKLILEYSVF